MLPWRQARLGSTFTHCLLLLIFLACCHADGSPQGSCPERFDHDGCSRGSDTELKDDMATLLQMKVDPELPEQHAQGSLNVLEQPALPPQNSNLQPEVKTPEDEFLAFINSKVAVAWDKITHNQASLTDRLSPATALVLLVMLAICVGVFFPVEKLDIIVSHTPDWLMVLGFLVFSSLMLVANKLTLVIIPLPATVLAVQLLFCASLLRLSSCMGLLQLDPCCLKMLLKFMGVPMSFALCLYTSLRVLLYSNVETTIMLRSAVPLVTSLTDVWFFDREWPSLTSVAALCTILISSVVFVHVDAAYDMRSYAWGIVWLGAFFFDVSYVKHVMNSVAMSTWTRVYYNNLLAGLLLLAPAGIEICAADTLSLKVHHYAAIAALMSSSVLGAGLSFSAFRVRVFLNATGFAVVNHVAKLFTILINLSIWQRHASPAGVLTLMLGLCATCLYEEAPPRAKTRAVPVVADAPPRQQQQTR